MNEKTDKTDMDWENFKRRDPSQINVHMRNKKGQTLLHLVHSSKYPVVEVAQLLITAGADVNARDKTDETPLHCVASTCQDPAVIATLIKAGAEIDARNLLGESPLHLAAMENWNPAIITELVNSGADINARKKSGSAADLLQAHGLITAVGDFINDGETPLHKAAKGNKNPAVVTELINAGADINAQSDIGLLPLHLAVHYTPLFETASDKRNLAVIAELIKAGAKINARGKGGITPLHCAAQSGTPVVILDLLKNGADAKATDSEGKTPFDWAQKNKTLKSAVEAYQALQNAQGITASRR